MFHLYFYILTITSHLLNKLKRLSALVLLITSTHSFADINNHYEKALTSFHQQKYKESIIHLKNSLQNNQTHAASRVLLAENYLALGEGSGAETQLITAQKNGADIKRLSPLFARSYLLQNKYDRVLEILNPRSNDIQLQSNILVFRGLAYLGKNNLPAADSEFSQALSLIPENEDALLGQAKLAIKKKQYNKVLPLILQVLTINPTHADALLMSAITYKNNQEIEEALNAINRLLKLTPDNYNALLVRSVLFVDLGQYDNALKDLNKITERIPNEPLSNYIKAATLSTINSTGEANEIYAHLAVITKQLPKKVMDEQPIYYFVAGLAYFQESNYKLAEKSLLTYIKFQPQDIKAIKLLAHTQIILGANNQAKKHLMSIHFSNKQDYEVNSLLGQVNMLTNDLVKAEYFYDLMIQEKPNLLSAQIELANFYLFSGKNNEIIQLFSKAVNDKEYALSLPSKALFMLTSAYKNTKQYSNALNIVNIIIEIEPENSYAYQEKGSLLGLSKQFSEARKSYSIAQELDETNFQVVIFLARYHSIEGNHQKAIELLTNQLNFGDNSALFIELGNAYEAINDIKNADLYYRKAYSYNSKSILALTKIVNKLISENQTFEAINLIEDYLRKYDDVSEVYELASIIYFQNNQHTKALYALNKAVKTSTNKGNSLLALANMQLRLNQRDVAINSLQRAISWEKGFVPAYLLLIAILTEDKNEDEALAVIKRLKEVNNDLALNQRLKGDLFWSLGNSKKSEKLFKSSITHKPNQAATLGLYRIYRKNKSFNKVEILLSEWIANNPNDLLSSISLAENYRQQQRLTHALDFYQKLMLDFPKSIILINNAALIAMELEQYEQATSLINRAYESNNKNVNIIDTKAWIELKKGNPDIALPLLREANTLDYQNAEVKYHLAITLDQLDRKSEALPFLKSAINSTQNFYDKDKARSILNKWKTL